MLFYQFRDVFVFNLLFHRVCLRLSITVWVLPKAGVFGTKVQSKYRS